MLKRRVSLSGILIMSALMTFCVTDVFAQAGSFGRAAISVPAAKSRGRSKAKAVKLPKGLVKKNKRKARKFKKITLASVNAALKKAKKGSRSKFKAIKAGQKISLGGKSGARGRSKKITAEEYVKRLNKLAKGFAAAGYATDGTGPDSNDVSGFDGELAKLKQQRARITRAFGKIGTLRVMNKINLPKLGKKGARGKKPYRLLGASKYKVHKAKAKRAGSRGKKPSEFRWEKKKVWGPYGAKKTAAVQIEAKMLVLANKDVVKFEATAAADSWIFNKKKTIFRAIGALGGDNRKAGGKGEVFAKINIKILGKNYTLLNKKAQGIRKGAQKSYQKSFSYTIRFTIVVVPCSVEVGASFKAGIRWQLNLLATKVNAAVIPFINSDAFARFAVDVGVAAAGIEGRVTLLDAEAKLHGEAGISGDSGGLFAYAYIAADLGIKALQGTINAFVKVKWCIFGCTKTYRHKIFGWKGFAKNWRLFKLEKRVYIIGKTPKNAAAAGNASAIGKAPTGGGGGGGWTQIPGSLIDVGVGKDGAVWGVNGKGNIFKRLRKKKQWKQIPGSLTRISVGSSKHVWGVNKRGDIYRRSGKRWDKKPGKATKIGVGSDGEVWVVNRKDEIYRWTGRNWTRIPGALREIAVGNRKNVWGVNVHDDIYKWDAKKKTWNKTSGKARTVGVASDGTVYVVNKHDDIYRRVGNSWRQISGKLKRVSVGSKKRVWGVNAQRNIYRRQ